MNAYPHVDDVKVFYHTIYLKCCLRPAGIRLLKPEETTGAEGKFNTHHSVDMENNCIAPCSQSQLLQVSRQDITPADNQL